MGRSNAGNEEIVGRSVPGSNARRRERVTPRQLWASRRSGGKPADEGLQKFDLPAPGAADGAPAARADVRQPASAHSESQAPSGAGKEKQVSATAGSPSAEASQKPEPQPPAAKPEHKMVEPSMQPGAMRYPYATHGLPPEPEERKRGASELAPEERQFSTTLVLGVLIILVGFLIGLALVGQHRRISSLQRRVSELERAVSSGFRSGLRP